MSARRASPLAIAATRAHKPCLLHTHPLLRPRPSCAACASIALLSSIVQVFHDRDCLHHELSQQCTHFPSTNCVLTEMSLDGLSPKLTNICNIIKVMIMLP
ncbi:hypothetical protein U9M48_030346 [Paspalum notatum var. saurae]|uniref:Uncharacterized protein n=1 Tax=Paspalum notatum var. saurae TaxID=547442 RepID=A0AAQ3X205_PASNO